MTPKRQPIGNVPKKPGRRRDVLEATLVGWKPNLYSCRLECGHVSMTRSRRGTEKPKRVYCPSCVDILPFVGKLMNYDKPQENSLHSCFDVIQ